MKVGMPGPGGMIQGCRAYLSLPTWGGKQGLLLDSLGIAWGWAAWGSRHTDCRNSRLVTYTRHPQKHQWDWLDSRAEGRAMSSRIPPVSWPSAGTTLMGFPFPGTKSCSSLEGWRCQGLSTGR